MMNRDMNHLSHIEGDINRLPPTVRAEIKKAEKRLTATLPPSAQAAFDAFHVDGVEHKAYFVPHFDQFGNKKYVFGILIY